MYNRGEDDMITKPTVMMIRCTQDNILSLEPNWIFVFGSNLSGRHGKGAARQALKWGAKPGQFYGRQGNTFAIPTVDKNISGPLPIKKIKIFVDSFIDQAKNDSGNIYMVTEIGCGLAGLKVKDIAPLFKDAIGVSNIFLPKRFWHKLID